MPGILRPATLAIALFLLLGAGAATASAAPRIAAYPALYPTFSTKVHDYVSRCHAGRPLLLAVHAPAKANVQLDRRRPTTGSSQTRLQLTGGRGVTVRIESATYHVRCLPKDFPAWTTERHGTPQAGWYIVTPAEGGAGSRFVVVFGRNGTPVWWMDAGYDPIDAKLLPDGNIAWSESTGTPYATHSVPYEERTFDGKLVRTIQAVGADTDGHDLQVLPNGDYLTVSYVPRDGVDLSPYGGPADATVTDALVEEVSPKGKLVWSWNSADHVDVSEAKPFMGAIIAQPAHLADGRTAYDIAHVNSIEPDGDSVLISLRHTDAIYKVSRQTGEIEWKLGGERTAQSLTVEGESLVFGGQHDARLQPDGTLTVHDNRTGSKLGPRALRFRIDESARTATEVEQITDPDATLSLCCGSARKLPGGNWVMSWGYNGLVTELTPAGQRVFALRFADGLFSYRAVPVLAKALPASKLRAGMDAMNGG